MSPSIPAHACPDCDEPLPFAFTEASGLGAWKTGDGYNTTPDTNHYVCFPCGKAWKQRLNGPLTADVVGDLVFFSCRKPDCGSALTVTHESLVPTEIQLTCGHGHQFIVLASDDGGLVLGDL